MADNLLPFKWIGLDKNGKRISGIFHAATEKDAQIELKNRAIEVIELTQKKQISFSFQRKKKVLPKDILLFTRFLSTMITAGLPIAKAIEVIGKDQDNPAMQAFIISLYNNIVSGKTLGETFKQYPQYFNSLYCSLIKAGEQSGTLDKILLRLANYLEITEALKRKIKKALTYPLAILTIAMIVTLILLLFAVPQFEKTFQSFGAKLPVFTQIVINFSKFLQSYWWLIILMVTGIVYAIRYLIKHNEKTQLMLDRISLKIYLVGNIMKKGIIARFARTLAITLDAGMPIVEAMKSMANIMGNRLYAHGVLRICEEVVNGNRLSTAMSNTNLFPNMTIQMVMVGEEAGRLVDMLNKIADYYEDDVNTIVDNLSSLIEPLIMAILGVIIGGFVIAMYLPIFKLGSLF
jgi:type IV pilus assembly protein PilC